MYTVSSYTTTKPGKERTFHWFINRKLGDDIWGTQLAVVQYELYNVCCLYEYRRNVGTKKNYAISVVHRKGHVCIVPACQTAAPLAIHTARSASALGTHPCSSPEPRHLARTAHAIECSVARALIWLHAPCVAGVPRSG